MRNLYQVKRIRIPVNYYLNTSLQYTKEARDADVFNIQRTNRMNEQVFTNPT